MKGENKGKADPTSGLPPRLDESALDKLADFPDLAATAQHIQLLNRKINRLQDLRVDAWNQMLAAVSRMYADGFLDDEDLYSVAYLMAPGYGPGFTRVWDRHGPLEFKYVIGRARTRDAREFALEQNKPNGPHGTWTGKLPFDCGDPIPVKGISVVYVLYDANGEPVYHGSTDNLRTRLRAHEKDKPEAAVWVSSKCEDRERAYQVEVVNLLRHLPRLNKKASR